jgi:hypothetical protein
VGKKTRVQEEERGKGKCTWKERRKEKLFKRMARV